MNAEAIIFMDAVRAAVPTRPDPRLGTALVPRLAATARESTLDAETRSMRRGTTTTAVASRRPRSRRALVARVAIAVALIPLVFAGLAVAGVTVPSAARSAFDAVGINLPNQPSNNSRQEAAPPDSQAPVGTTGTTTTTGTTPTEGNSQAAHEHARSQHDKAKGKATGHERGKAIGLNEGTPPGQSGDTGPPAHSNAGGNGQGVANGESKTPPGRTKTPPGHAKVPPGQAKVPPGQAKK